MLYGNELVFHFLPSLQLENLTLIISQQNFSLQLDSRNGPKQPDGCTHILINFVFVIIIEPFFLFLLQK